jgi:hypothetical protein
MNRVRSGDFGLENQIVFLGEFLKQTLFSLSDFLFVFLESLFDVIDSVNHQTPEQFSQFARQGQVGHQPPSPTFEPPIEAAQGFVHTATDAPGNHAKQPSGPVARTFLAASALATAPTARRQSQPAANPAIASLLHSSPLVGRVAELGSLGGKPCVHIAQLSRS